MAEYETKEVFTAPATGIVTVTFSHGRDLYRIAPEESVKRMWLSVAKFPLPMPESVAPHMPYLGAVRCGAGWRKAYSVDWSVVRPGLTMTLPATDELVVDYGAADVSEPGAEA